METVHQVFQRMVAGQFDYLGHYNPVTWFVLVNRTLAKCCATYAWVRDHGDGTLTPLRFGHASSLQRRYNDYNSWLRRGGKRNNPNNQETCRLTKLGANPGMIVLARKMPDKGAARRLEDELRHCFGSVLDLDLEAPASWIRQQQDLFIQRRRQMQ